MELFTRLHRHKHVIFVDWIALKTNDNDALEQSHFVRLKPTAKSVQAIIDTVRNALRNKSFIDTLSQKLMENGVPDSVKQSVYEATCDDIIKAIGSLVENGIKVLCVAHDWNMVPKCHPEGVAELALAEKMATLEGKLKVFEETLGDQKQHCAE